MTKRDQDWVTATLAVMKPLAERFPDGWTTINDMVAERVSQCPSRAAANTWPGWSSVLAARQVGLAALATGILDARDAVRAAITDLLADGDPDRDFQRAQDWIASLSKTARLDIADEALRWLVAWRSIGPEVSERDLVERGAVQTRLNAKITLRASADALVRPPRGADSTVYVSTGAVPNDEDDLGIAARVAAVLWLQGHSVGTAVVLHPKSRQSRTFDVDTELVTIGADHYLAALRVVVNQALGIEQAARVSGPNCRWCDLLEDCPTGQHYLATTPQVSGGLPIARQ